MTNPKYPIYVISKGRADTRFTSRTFEQLQIPYRVVIEESEYKAYSAVIDPKKILVMPKDFRENPKWAITCEATGLLGGSIPARNWVWDHSISEGHERHWIVDDNIRHFYRLNRNKKIRVSSGITFKLLEDFTDRYQNVMMSGMNYDYFLPESVWCSPYRLNTRVYSCILLHNSLKLRWRGRFNEDTDLSLRILKEGHCTMLFNAFCCGKQGTLMMKGGNTETVYGKDQSHFDNRYTFAESLYKQHPDVTTIVKRYGGRTGEKRWHHWVDYTGFRQQPVYKAGIVPTDSYDDHGMVLKNLNEEELEQEKTYWK